MNYLSRAGSSSIPPPRRNYEVFLSFRGDTRRNFTDHLYHRLVARGIAVFRDNEELHVGEKIDQLFEAIKVSKVSIPIVSPGYASSLWCLNELVQILECKKTSGLLVKPIFYHVKPSDVREQKGDFGKAFQLQEEKSELDGALIQQWKNALMEVSYLKGWESVNTANGYEGQLVEIVVAEVLKALKKPTLVVCDHLVGVEDHVEKIMDILNVEERYNKIRAILLQGMGGIGKTTLAKVLYNQLAHHFECCSYLANIRETSSQHKGMEGLQKKLISDILGQKWPEDISNVDEGVNIIRERFNTKKVLILLDDVDHRDQLNALAGMWEWFGRGSIFIVTSRRKDILERWEGIFSYELNGLDPNQSFQLFCRHAFKESDAIPDEYDNIAKEMVATTGGLPLAIEVIGSLLYGKPKDFWEANLKMLKEIPHHEVQSKLRISFDALQPEEKEIFLDITCLEIHRKIEYEYALRMWDGCNFYPRLGIDKLISMCLVQIGEAGEIIIHDQLRDLGREVVRQESVSECGNRSRLWKVEEAQEVLGLKKGTTKVKCLILQFPRIYGDQIIHCTSEQFKGMRNLRFLHMENGHLIGDFENLFLNLRWLNWSTIGEPSDIMGIDFNPKKLVVLQLCNSNITDYWKGWNKHLRVLKLEWCNHITTTPDFSTMEGLEVLVLHSCYKLGKIHPSIGKISKTLKVLDVSLCQNLEELPIEVGKMEELRELIIDDTPIKEIPFFEGCMTKLETLSAKGCMQLKFIPSFLGSLLKLQQLILEECCLLAKIPEEIGNIKSLTGVYISSSGVIELPDSIGDLYNLQELKLCSCSLLTKIPKSIGKLKSLTKLDLSFSHVTELSDSIGDLHNLEELNLKSCSSLTNIPESIKRLKLLNKLDLSWTKVTELADSIGDLYNLEELKLCDCRLTKIPESIGKLKLLTKLDLSGSCVTELPYSIGDLYNLQELDLNNCSSLTKIPESIRKVKLLTKLDLSKTHVTELPDSIGDLYNLQELKLCGCSLLAKISKSTGKLKSLTKLDLSWTYVTELPNSIGDLYNLQELKLCACTSLTKIPESIIKLKLLTKLDLRWTPITKLPDSIGDLHNLQELDLSSCSSLTKIPESIGKLKSLTKLVLSCTNVTELPDSIGDLYNLLELTLPGCSLLRKIPASIGKLELLTKLDLGWTCITKLPNSIGDLYNLQELKLYACTSLKKIPESIGKLKSLTKLDLTSTRITKLPDSIGDLHNLEQLLMYENPARSLPASAAMLYKLQELSLEGCSSLKKIPKSIGKLKLVTKLKQCTCYT